MAHEFSSAKSLAQAAMSHVTDAEGAIGSHADQELAKAVKALAQAIRTLIDAFGALPDSA